MTTIKNKKAALIIMDGWGINKEASVDAIAQAKTPFVDRLYDSYPHTTLVTYGEQVGLPKGQMGNSEVGHMNLGAGRIVYQELLKINNAIKDNSFFDEKTLIEALKYAKTNHKPIHLMGLVSDGGVHSHINHIKALIDLFKQHNIEQSYLHVFTDGRDTDPNGGKEYVKDLLAYCSNTKTKIASLIGRYYAMDRDKRWERIQLAYDLLVRAKGKESTDLLASIDESYANNVTDEFIQPIIMMEDGQPVSIIQSGDVVICFNFRTDRCRQITEVLTQKSRLELGMQTLALHYVTMTRYDNSFKNIHVVYDKAVLKDTIGEVVANAGCSQLRIAETEKYPHVSFFFSGGREANFESEDRIMVPSPMVATYDLQPEMSAYEVTDKVIAKIEKDAPDFVCLNFANTDMVGHTGVFKAAIKAAETVDKCVQKVVEACLANNYTVLLTADHGNADMMINPDKSANTAHTVNPVPLFLISDPINSNIQPGKLADIAPTILKIMGLSIPDLMTGKILIDD